MNTPEDIWGWFGFGIGMLSIMCGGWLIGVCITAKIRHVQQDRKQRREAEERERSERERIEAGPPDGGPIVRLNEPGWYALRAGDGEWVTHNGGVVCHWDPRSAHVLAGCIHDGRTYSVWKIAEEQLREWELEQ